MSASIRAGSAGLVMLVMLGGAPAAAGQTSGPAAFVFLVGADTFGIERFTTTGQAITGEILLQGQPRVTYFATRAGAGRIGELRVVVYPGGSGPDAAALQSAGVHLVNDTAVAEIIAGGTTRTERLATQPDAFLLLNASVAILELTLERLQAANRDTVSFPVFLLTGGRTVTALYDDLQPTRSPCSSVRRRRS